MGKNSSDFRWGTCTPTVWSWHLATVACKVYQDWIAPSDGVALAECTEGISDCLPGGTLVAQIHDSAVSDIEVLS